MADDDPPTVRADGVTLLAQVLIENDIRRFALPPAVLCPIAFFSRKSGLLMRVWGHHRPLFLQLNRVLERLVGFYAEESLCDRLRGDGIGSGQGAIAEINGSAEKNHKQDDSEWSCKNSSPWGVRSFV